MTLHLSTVRPLRAGCDGHGLPLHCLRCVLGAAALCVAAAAGAEPVEAAGRDGRSQAQEVAALAPADAPLIVVKGQALRGQDNAFSTSRIAQDQIRDRRVARVEELFRDIPGMNVNDFQLGAVASSVVIRGFGGGGHGGDLGVVVDGIPLNEANSHADGYVDTDVLVPLEIDNLTVYRGPVSALYGNFNRGGLVAYETRKQGRYLEADVSGGEFGTLDAQAAAGSPVGDSGQFNGALQAFRSDGFRAQSETTRQTAAGRYRVDLTERLDLAIAARVHTADADSAAYLTPEQFARDPYGIDPRTQNDGAEKDFATARTDLGYTLDSGLRVLGFAYTTGQDFVRWFSRGPADPAASWNQREEAYDRQVFGAGTSLNGRSRLAGRDVAFVLGVETFSEATEFQFHDGLDRRRRTAPAQNDRESRLRSVSGLGEANLSLHRYLDASLGLRFDRFTGECRLRGPETGSDPCDDLDAVDHLSPKIGLRSEVLPWLQLRASFSEGFALPGGFTKYAPGAEGLDPNVLRQLEFGLRLVPGSSVDLDLVGYRIESSQEFATVAPGEFENFGQTLRTGAEATLGWQVMPTVDLRAVYAYADSEVERNRNPDLLGRSVTGVADHTATLHADWQALPALNLSATYRHVGDYAVNATNTLRADSYEVVDLGASYALAGRRPVRLYVAVINAFDDVYATTVNTIGLAPGAPMSLRAGVQFSL